MSDWLDKLNAAKGQKEVVKDKTHIIQSGAFSCFDELQSIVAQKLKDANKRVFGGTTTLEIAHEMNTITPGQFLVQKLVFPALYLKIRLDDARQAVKFDLSEVSTPSQSRQIRVSDGSGTIVLDTDDSDSIVLKADGVPISFDEAAERMLTPMISRILKL